MSQILYPVFYKQYGVRRVQNLLTPKPMTITGLPRDSMLHFYSANPAQPHVDTSKLYLGVNARKVLIDFPETLTCLHGGPRSHPTQLRALFKDFLHENKKFRYLKNGYQAIDDTQTLFIENYSFLNVIYTYTANVMVEYQKWFNVHKTIIDKMNSVADTSGKNHFYFCDVPDEMPSFSLLNTYSARSSTSMLRVFDTHEKLFILNLFRWISKDRNGDDCIFQGLKKENFGRVNIVFNTKDGRSVVLNLAFINSWIKGNENLTGTKMVSQVDPDKMQKAFLKFLMGMQTVLQEEEVTIATPTEGKAADPADVSENRELEEEQREYDNVHDQSEEDELDVHEYDDALSMANRIQTSTKTSPSPVNFNDTAIDEALNAQETLDEQLKSLDADIETLEALTVRRLKDKGIQVDAAGDVKEEVIAAEETPIHELQQKVYQFEDVESSLKRQIGEQTDYGLLSASDYKNFMRDMENYKNSDDPYGSGKKTLQAMVVTPEAIELSAEKVTIQASEMVQDKSMLQSSLLAFDQDYIGKVIQKDMLSMVHALQKSGVAIRKHEVEIDHSALGSYENHTLEFKPVDGQVSTVRFRVPKISEDGTFVANGNKYVMRKQRVDIPIRKIKPTEVALTSYYGKTFVRINSKKSNNSLEWIIKELNIASMTDHPFIKRVNPAKVFDNNFKAPYIYNALADNFKSVITTKYTLVFDYTEREKMASPDTLQRLEVNGARVIGFTSDKQLLVVDKNNNFFIDSKGEPTAIGDIYNVLQLDPHKAPVDFTEVNIFSKAIPVAFVLGFTIGFKNLVKLLQVKYRVTEGRQQKNLQSHEYAISFKDYSYIFSRKDRAAALVLAGYNEFEKQLRMYEVDDFGHKDVYLNLLESKGLSSIYMRELELNQQLFVDPITKEILQQMKEPVTFNGLLLRATEMMMGYEHPDSQDMAVMRIRGYERIPGAVYKEMVGAIRQYRNRNIAGKSKVDISPYQIWSNVMKDPAIKLVEDINPIQNLKETEIVTYVGEGGRGKDSMNKASRAYHPNDMGIVSEATVDSSDVGVNAYLSANPKFRDLRGLPLLDKKTATPSNLVSTSAILAPAADKDDPKRVNFISVQQGHTIATKGYHQPMIRTGYEYVIANRTGDMFAFTAKQDGVVSALTPTGIIVDYKDGTKKGVTLGRVYGKAEGSVYPHDIVTKLTVGQKFKKGDAVAYNEGFFEQDILDPTKIVMKNSLLAKTVLYESNETHEDSSAISKELSGKLSANTTKTKSYLIDFKQNLLDVVKQGQDVSPKDTLMIIEDEITSGNSSFDEASLQALKRLANQSPRAGFLGKVDKIEVFYHGDKADMSSGLKALADRSDRAMVDSCKSSGKPVITGQVNDEYRVGGVPLSLDKAEVKFYITIETSSGVGDKAVFGSQLKSVIGKVLDYSMTAEDGTPIEAVFGFRSVMARITLSTTIMGTTATLMKVIAKRAVEIYKQ